MKKVLLLGLAALMGCEAFFDPQSFDRKEVEVFRAEKLVEPPAAATPARLQVMAWNIKYGAGRIPFWFDCWGDRIQMSLKEVEANMEGLYGLIKEVDPDILMTEEIEFNSRRSAYVNMVQEILDNTDLNYAGFYESWDSRYIPSEGLGRINLGVAIFSKYPIKKAESIKQDERTDLAAHESPFYIKRVIGRAEIALDETRSVAAFAVHTAAFDKDGTKQKQLKQIEEVVQAEALPAVVGGDFNEIPPNAVTLHGFADERTTAVCGDDFETPPYSPGLMNPFFEGMIPAVTLEQMGDTQESQSRYFTHTMLGSDQANEAGEAGFWTRTLDYLFATSGSWVPGSTDVLQQRGQRIGGEDGVGPKIEGDVMNLSDHAPVVGIWEVGQ